MSAHPALRRFTPEECLLIERDAETKTEYVDGVVYAMAEATRGHNSTAMNTVVTFQMRLRGKGCRAHSSDVRVSVSDIGPHSYPDVSVVCGSDPDWRADIVGVPILVCEVSSDSTVDRDREVTLKAYRLMPSLCDILLISQHEVEVQHYFKQKGEMWDTKQYSQIEESILLVGLQTAMPMAEIYEGVH
jgi:Uma2 family endonuclease